MQVERTDTLVRGAGAATLTLALARLHRGMHRTMRETTQ